MDTSPTTAAATIAVTVVAVTVVYCAVDTSWLVPLQVAPGTTLRQAIIASGALRKFPELATTTLDAGVFGHRRALEATLANGDRVEIYRPLQLDPMAARRLRAQARRQRKLTPRSHNSCATTTRCSSC